MQEFEQNLKRPLLRPNTEMHAARINKISSDAAGRWILSCSIDKTAKLWDTQQGKLIRTLRIPIEEGNLGHLYACALSPDGSTAAVGGLTTQYNHKNTKIYVINTSTGEILQCISGLGTMVFDIKFHLDGTLAAAIGGGGIQIFKPSGKNYELFQIQTDCLGNFNDLTFTPSGRLISAGMDGCLYLYDSQLQLISKVTPQGGAQPFSIALSSDGRKLAVAYDDSGNIEVLNADTLDLLYRPDISGADHQNQRINKLSFGYGGYLYGGGMLKKKATDGSWRYLVRRWNDDGQGSFVDLNGPADIISDIKALPDGSVIFADAQPDLGRLSASEKILLYNTGENLRFFSDKEINYLTVNEDGSQILFNALNAGPFAFNVNKLELTPSSAQFQPFRDTRANLQLADWRNSLPPKLNGQALEIQEYFSVEPCQSVDIASDGTFILGISLLYLFEVNGKLRWKTKIPGSVRALRISANKRVAIAAHDGGEISWYRMRDGARLFTLKVHPDGKNWILYHPLGYYAASSENCSLLGWHVNNDPENTPTFYPLSKFSSNFYRPDILQAILVDPDMDVDVDNDIATAVYMPTPIAPNQEITSGNIKNDKYELHEKQDLQENSRSRWRDYLLGAIVVCVLCLFSYFSFEKFHQEPIANNLAKKKPPEVAILSPLSGTNVSTNPVIIRYKVKSFTKEKIANTTILIDGTPWNERGIKVKNISDISTASITIPPKNCAVSIVADDNFGTSLPATIQLHWKGMEHFTISPKLYVLAIGVSTYSDERLTLKFAAKDAKDLAQVLTHQKGRLYSDVKFTVLTNQDATRGNILDGLDWILKQTTQNDVAMVFLAGHGLNDNYGAYYFLPQNVDIDRLRRTGVSYSEIKEVVTNIAGKALFFIDTCHSGNVLGQRRNATDTTTKILNELANAENGVIVFAASTGRQSSLENSAWGNGAFTEALVEGFSGKAAFRDNKITVNMLDLYVSERVKTLTGGQQTPTTTKPATVPDFPIALK